MRNLNILKKNFHFSFGSFICCFVTSCCYFTKAISLQLEARQVTPPYSPAVTSDRDLQHFDTTFTDEAPNLTPDDPLVA